MGTQGDRSLLDAWAEMRYRVHYSMYTGGLYLGRNEKKAVFSFCSSVMIRDTRLGDQCRWGETQSHAPNQPNQIHTTPNTELRRSRTKNPRQNSCIWFNRTPILLQSSPIKLSSQSLSPKPSEPNSIKKTLTLLLLES